MTFICCTFRGVAIIVSIQHLDDCLGKGQAIFFCPPAESNPHEYNRTGTYSQCAGSVGPGAINILKSFIIKQTILPFPLLSAQQCQDVNDT